MKVALVYDDLASLVPDPRDPLDVGGEWEDERTISGQAEALRSLGYEVMRIPYDAHFHGRLLNERPQVVFNIAEGRHGRDRESLVPAICRLLNIACTSSDAVGMGLTLNKALCKAVARAAGVPTPDWWLVRDSKELHLLPKNETPLFVKPNLEGSSMGIRPESLVRDPEKLRPQVEWVLENVGETLIERALPGAEYTVGLLGNDDLLALPIAEIRTHGKVYDKSMKSKDKLEEEILCPIATPYDAELVAWSKRLFVELGLGGFARFDYKCDETGRPHFMEVNPLPGLSRYYSVFTIQAAAFGLSYEALLGRIVELALLRAKEW